MREPLQITNLEKLKINNDSKELIDKKKKG
jgi:hypothetical protein